MTKGKPDPTPEEASYGERFARIVGLYQQSIAGNKQAVEEANRLLESLRSDYPGHPVADAYHGGIMIFMAREKRNPLLKLRRARKGMKLLDKAVAASPQDIAIRLIRGKAAYHLPEKQFRRTETAIEDYMFLLEHETELRILMNSEGVLQLIDELGDAYFRIGRNLDAADWWSRLEQQAEYPAYRALARKKLKSAQGKPPIQEAKQTDVSATSVLIGFAASIAENTIMDMAGIEKRKPSKRRRGKGDKSNGSYEVGDGKRRL